MLGRDARPRVGHREEYAAAHVDARGDADLVPLRATERQRLRRVDEQVQADLTELGLVDADRRDRGEVADEACTVPDLVVGQLDRAPYFRVGS